ncbi:MAG: transketolase [Rhodospirillaceae bacterium]|nr:transketolase [Rhodospirillales bacterium]
MELNERNTGMWSKIGSRATFGLVMADLGKTVDDLMVLTADTSTSAGLDRFKKAFPDKFQDMGIAEQNMVGVAAGLASEGFKVVTATFAPFMTMRCCEQVRINLGYMQHGVTLVGLASGVVLGTLGYTHCCVEDLAVMRAIPGLTVLSPADCGETAKAVEAAINSNRPTYIRLTGGKDNPAVYKTDYDFQIGKGVVLRDGTDVALVATGTMVYQALNAASILADQGISASVVDMHTIKPMDAALVEQLCKTAKLIVTVEEHSVLGGLGSAVAEVVATLNKPAPQLFLGLPGEFGKTGEYQDILDHYGLCADKIAHKVAERFSRL